VRILESILTLYAWVAALVFIAALFLIARFYQIKSGESTYYRVYIVPAILFVIAGVRYAFFSGQDWVGDVAANLLFLCGGIVALVLGSRLLKLMTGGGR
jgi:hypothetical protein